MKVNPSWDKRLSANFEWYWSIADRLVLDEKCETVLTRPGAVTVREFEPYQFQLLFRNADLLSRANLTIRNLELNWRWYIRSVDADYPNERQYYREKPGVQRFNAAWDALIVHLGPFTDTDAFKFGMDQINESLYWSVGTYRIEMEVHCAETSKSTKVIGFVNITQEAIDTLRANRLDLLQGACIRRIEPSLLGSPRIPVYWPAKEQQRLSE